MLVVRAQLSATVLINKRQLGTQDLIIAGAHVRQPEHWRMCLGPSCGGSCQEDR